MSEQRSSIAANTFKGHIIAFGGDIHHSNERFYVKIRDEAGKTIRADTADKDVVNSIAKLQLEVSQHIEIEVIDGGELYGAKRIAELEPLAKEIDNAMVQTEESPENTIRPVSQQVTQAMNSMKRAKRNTIRTNDEGANGSITNAKLSEGASQAFAPLATLGKGRFIRGEGNIYRRIGEQRPALADEGERIRFIDKQMDAFEAGVELAQAKGWEAIELTGTDKFRAEAWFFAKTAGLDVIGYEPTEVDLKRLEAFREKTQEKGQEALQTVALEEIVRSKANAEKYAFSQDRGVQGINTDRGRYSGKVLHETEHHVVQDIGAQATVIHAKSALDPAYQTAEGRTLRVQYQNGRGTVEQEKSQERALSR